VENHHLAHHTYARQNRYRVVVPHFQLRPIDVDMEREDAAHFHELGEAEELNVRRFNSMAATFPMRFSNIEAAESFVELVPAIFDHEIDHFMEGADDNDYVGAELLHPSFQRPVLNLLSALFWNSWERAPACAGAGHVIVANAELGLKTSPHVRSPWF